MHSNSFRLQVLMSLLLSHLYACMRIIYMYDHPPNFDTNPRSKKKHKPLENTGQPHQTRVHGGGVPYIYIYICIHIWSHLPQELHLHCSVYITFTKHLYLRCFLHVLEVQLQEIPAGFRPSTNCISAVESAKNTEFLKFFLAEW